MDRDKKIKGTEGYNGANYKEEKRRDTMALTTKKKNEAIITLVIIGGVIWLVTKFFEAIGGTQNVLILCVALVAVFAIYKGVSHFNVRKKTAARRSKLISKYQDY
ncbi:hypothetical protein OAP18_03640, partial [Gammaproteobacteria bacterium]|nr:hypothetical protein [Gammaproteobacteria bacterium]